MIRTVTMVCAGGLMLATLAGCSSSDSDGDSPGGGVGLGILSGYCTAKLLTDQPVKVAESSGVWVGDGSVTAPAGTEFVVEPAFDKWRGYYFVSGGKAGRISGDSSTGLIKDTDFTSDCATDVNAFGTRVLLQDSTVYPNSDLSGDACTLPAGTSFDSFSYTGGGGSATITAKEIMDACGFQTAYSSDFIYAELLPK